MNQPHHDTIDTNASPQRMPGLPWCLLHYPTLIAIPGKNRNGKLSNKIGARP
jgi:hypothetical protein